MPAVKPDRDSLPAAPPTNRSLHYYPSPAKCELDTDGFQSGFLLLDKQDPGQAHNPSSNLVKLVMWLLTEIYFDLPFFEF